MTSRLRIPHFSLRHTLECGQFFRFTRDPDAYLVQSLDRIFSIRQERDLVFYDGVEESFLIQFFRLEDDLGAIYKEIDVDPIIHRAMDKYRGMRLIRQDPWECLVSFLCSSAKAIAHIRCIIEMLCRTCGKKIVWKNHIGYGFPEPKCIGDPHTLEPVKAGFRANYLLRANECIDGRKLLSLKALSYQEAREELMKLSGVGKKVADCTLLYSLDFLEAFPMDTWIKKGLQKAYFNGEKISERKTEEFVSNHFGPYAGYAQLYLFHFWRNHPFGF